MSKVLAGGKSFGAQDYLNDPMPAQVALQRARAEYGFALCQCVAPARQLVIREIKGVLYLAVWPNDGHFHDVGCEFHRDLADEADQPARTAARPNPPPLSNGKAGPRLRPAAQINHDGQWDVRLDVPRERGPTPIEQDGSHHTGQGGGGGTARDAFSLAQFLSWLWDNTSMTRWARGWNRDWWRVSRTVRTAAAAVTIEGFAFNELLYIPPPFRKDREAEIHAEWDDFARPLIEASARGETSRGFILGEIKAVDKTDYGYRLVIRNMAKPVFVDAQVFAQITKQAPLGLSLLPQRKERGCGLVALLLVEGTGKGNIRTISAAMMLVNKSYLPVNSIPELELANRLCDADRTFTRGVGRHVGADFVLRDTTPATAMVIYALTSRDYVRQRDQVVELCKDAGCDIWKWSTSMGEQMPPIPGSTV